MVAILKKLFGSSKFWVAVIGGAILGGMNYAGVEPETQTKVVAIISTLLGAMGLADLGKNAKTTPPAK